MKNQTVIVDEFTTERNATITNITYKGFWTYGLFNGQQVKIYEGWNSWEVIQ